MSWKDYWGSEKNIDNLILDKWSTYYCRHIEKITTFSNNDVVLDFGCGDGKIAKFLAKKVDKVIAYDNSCVMYELCKKNTASNKNIICKKKLENKTKANIVIMHSTLQYINFQEFKNFVCYLSTAAGVDKMVISDIVPKGHNIYYEAINNLFYAFRNFFFMSYTLFLFNELRKRLLSKKILHLCEYSKNDLVSIMREYGWRVVEVENLSPSKNRYTVICYKDLT